jgi:hypothetical protein
MKEYARAAGVFFLMGFFLATPEAGWAQEPSVMPLKLPVDETVRSLAISALEHAPLRFVANGGKYAGEVAYYARSKGATVYCTDQGVIFGFADGQIRLTFSDHRRVRPEGRGLLPGVVNYFMGKEAGQWQAGIPTYQEVTYSEVYPGIDLVYEGSHRLLKYTYYVQPGSDPGQIQMRFDGVNGISVDTATRELVIQTRWGEMRDAPPVAYQEIGGVRKEVDVSFCLMDEGRIGFSVGAYDPDGLLVIDPVYSTYLGGGDLDEGHDIAVDGDGNVYVAGYTSSLDFPALNAMTAVITAEETRL